jgi:2-oxoglutarate dehydrogenase E2 component (dihydrolipoamide succinyltransferase)
VSMPGITEVLVPANGEGTRATVLRWCKQVGDRVVKDEPLVELETDKVTVEIPSPADGRLVEILKTVDAEVMQDEVLARLSSEDSIAVVHEAAAPARAEQEANTAIAREGRAALSPSVRRLLSENSVVAADIAGTGRNGRITAQDVMRHVAGDSVRQSSVAAEAAPSPPPARVADVVSLPPRGVRIVETEFRPGSSRIPHTAVRRRVAEHMSRSMLEAPHVTTLFEVDLTRVLAHRARYASIYGERGTRLTLTAYFTSACVRALRAHPQVNATFHAEAMEVHADVNIGIGTALGDKGLIVPVIHRAQSMNLFGLAHRLGELVYAARIGKLAPEDVRGGTFTISNHGVGGSLLASPIVINQPQVAILGVGKVERRVCVMEVDGVEAIGVRSMCYLTLTIDHRALDAFQANAFLSAVASTLETWPDVDD